MVVDPLLERLGGYVMRVRVASYTLSRPVLTVPCTATSNPPTPRNQGAAIIRIGLLLYMPFLGCVGVHVLLHVKPNWMGSHS